MQRKMAVVLVADIAGYSRLMETDEEGTLRRLQSELHELIEPKLTQHHGRLFKTTGDGLLAEFQSVVDAVRFALDMQRALAGRNAGLADARRLSFRIGINLGDVIAENGDLYGDGVNVAARLEALADPGGVMLSGTAYDQVKRNVEAGFQFLGEQRVKNIAEPLRVYRVLMDPKDAGRTIGPPRMALSRRRWLALAMAIVLLGLLGAIGMWLRPWEQREPERSIAVLPFKNLSGDKEQDYLAAGITEDLTTDLARIPGMFVSSRNAAIGYKGKDANPAEVAAELGVRYVLEGSIRRVGDDLRINAQLIDAKSGGHLWAERFDGDFADVFSLQERVIAAVATALELRLTPNQEKQAGGTSNPAAYEAYLKGLELYTRSSNTETPADDLKKAIPHFDRAIALDPQYGQAYAALGWVYGQAYWVWAPAMGLSWDEARDKAYEYLQKALEYPSAQGYRLAAERPRSVHLHEEAIRNLERAIALDPNDSKSYVGMAYWLTLAGRLEDGQRYVEAARRLDPRMDEYSGYVVALAQFSAEDFAAAATTTEKYLVKNPNYPSMHILLAAAYAELGRIPEAEQQRQRADEIYNAKSGDPFTILWAMVDFPFKEAADTERLAAALRKAGVPELQFGYDAVSEDRLTGEQIKSLLLGRTARYRNLENPAFTAVTSFTADGIANVRNTDGEQTGYFAVNEKGLCILWEQDRECAVIFQNPSGTRDQGNEFFWVNAWSHFAFIIE